jgi:flagellar protein FliJ
VPARFQFGLQPLLDWRSRVEEEKQRDFAAARRLLEECDRELERLAAEYAQAAKRLVASASTERTRELRLGDSYLRFIQAAMASERSRRCELQSACDRVRDALVVASRERRVIERLKERRRREFEAAEARWEELEIDESNARGHERAVREGLGRRKAETSPP